MTVLRYKVILLFCFQLLT